MRAAAEEMCREIPTLCKAGMAGTSAEFALALAGTEVASVSNSKLAAWGVPADVCTDVTNPGDCTAYQPKACLLELLQQVNLVTLTSSLTQK